jgi:hypothetical protein
LSGAAPYIKSMNTNTTQFEVRSFNFSWHTPIMCATYADALAAAKARGFDATIQYGAELVASWSALYGVKVYDRALAGMGPGL